MKYSISLRTQRPFNGIKGGGGGATDTLKCKLKGNARIEGEMEPLRGLGGEGNLSQGRTQSRGVFFEIAEYN